MGRTNWGGRAAVLAAAGALSACGLLYTVVEADPVIAGRRYADQPIGLGPVKMKVHVRPQLDRAFLYRPSEPGIVTDPEIIELSLGFRAVGAGKTVLAREATLTYGTEPRRAEPFERVKTGGSPDGCTAEPIMTVDVDYWFNGYVEPDLWSCVTIRLHAPGRRPGDPLRLAFEPLNVAGSDLRVLPITFELH